MKSAKQQRKGKASGTGRQSAVLVLSFIVCFVSIFYAGNIHQSSALQALDVWAHVGTQGRLPNAIVHGTHAPRLETFFSRAVHWAVTSALHISVSLPSLARRIESPCGKHVLSMLVDSGLEVRAPPEFLLS